MSACVESVVCVCVCVVSACVTCVVSVHVFRNVACARGAVCAFDACIQESNYEALTFQHAQPKSWQEEHQYIPEVPQGPPSLSHPQPHLHQPEQQAGMRKQTDENGSTKKGDRTQHTIRET